MIKICANILLGITFVMTVMFIYLVVGMPLYRGLIAFILAIMLFVVGFKERK